MVGVFFLDNAEDTFRKDGVAFFAESTIWDILSQVMQLQKWSRMSVKSGLQSAWCIKIQPECPLCSRAVWSL